MLEASISPLILRYLQFFGYFKRPHLLWRKPMLFCRRIRNVITRDCIGLTIAGRYHCTFARITIYYKKKIVHVCLLMVSMLPLFLRYFVYCLLHFGTVLTYWYFLLFFFISLLVNFSHVKRAKNIMNWVTMGRLIISCWYTKHHYT